MVVDTVDRAGEADDFDIGVGGDASIASESTGVIEEDFAFALRSTYRSRCCSSSSRSVPSSRRSSRSRSG